MYVLGHCFGYSLWDTVKLTLQVGCIFPFVFIDPTNIGATIMVAQALCLTTFSQTPNAENLPVLPMLIKLACVYIYNIYIVVFRDYIAASHIRYVMYLIVPCCIILHITVIHVFPNKEIEMFREKYKVLYT